MQTELRWAEQETTINPRQRRIYRAVWLLLDDLIRVGWQYRWTAGTFEIAPPAPQQAQTREEVARLKVTLREAMKAPRLEKLIEGRDFIKRMETPKDNGVSIRSLIGDGASLASDLN